MVELVKIQAELKAPKGQKNTFGNYKYRSAEDILEAVKPIATALGCYLVISDTIELIGDRYYVKATAMIKNSEGLFESTCAYARESLDKKGMDSSQITGATSSYARKYALNGLFCIDDTKDADTLDNRGEGRQSTTDKTKAPVISSQQPSNVEGFTKPEIDNDYRASVVHTIGRLCREINKCPVKKELTKDQRELCQETLFSVSGFKSVVNEQDVQKLEKIQKDLEALKG